MTQFSQPFVTAVTAPPLVCCVVWSLDSCFFFSTRAHTSRLISGGAIQASMYRSSTLVGFRQLVIALHAVLCSESST